MLNRRSFAVGAGSAIVLSACCPVCSASKTPTRSRGCSLAPEGFDAVRSSVSSFGNHSNESTTWRSGDADFDFALAQTLANIAKVFNILPSFGFYDDRRSENAYATERTTLDRTDGSVFFGLNLLKRLRSWSSTSASQVAIATICAHEFAHILQYKRGLDETLAPNGASVKRLELQADYLAGYFTGLRKRELSTYPAAEAALWTYDIGDTEFGAPDHHGTPAERGAAVERGFQAAYREKRLLEEAIEESTRYVMSL